MIPFSEYAKRRKALMKQLDSSSIVVLSGAKDIIRNGDAFHPFRQQSDFYYLTGFNEPSSIMALLPNNKDGETILFNLPRNPEEERWTGPRTGQHNACKHYLFDAAYSIGQFEEKLPELLTDRNKIYYPFGLDRQLERTLSYTTKKLHNKKQASVKTPTMFIDILPMIHDLRVFKSATEIATIQHAIDITSLAHLRAMEAARPKINECELDAILTYEFKRQGAPYPAYSNIVAAGKNACTLHYTDNNRIISKNDLILIDAGAEYNNYAADITRTFPVNGRFSPEQRAIYNLVLNAQLAGIQAIKPHVRWNRIQTVIVSVITEGLKELGILKGKTSDLIDKKAYLPFYMHGSGHFLGLDVHDVGYYKTNDQWRMLEAGMVLTVEPGIYITNPSAVHRRFHHIGVRIEDDIVVTQKGCEVLSQHLPKTADEIETIVHAL
ncbi:MAG: hypothetical protein ACD_45C00724G0002 [uncultured bacterium]|nr:MAG: hypothetical protein ACD_45C00724G0002 [uncultured bacterium]OGT56137.1 MAG: hypothetical protein A3F43_02380 [Gammaproteobacteria bacterium RIFCSPHIGHO2_12_FULL_42_10]